MKNLNVFLLSFMCLLWLATCQQPSNFDEAKGIQVTFEVDLAGVEIQENAIVGIRGDIPPLSWAESLHMNPGEKGNYKVTLDFPEAKPGQIVHYKYIIGEDTWELSNYGLFGNRFLILTDGLQSLSSSWSELEDFSPLGLRLYLEDRNFYNLVFLVGNGKKRGLSVEEIVAEESAFWGNSSDYWLTTLEDWAIDIRIQQAATENGYFQILEQSPTKIIMQVGPPLWESNYNIAKQDDSSSLYGVTKEDLKAYDEHWMEILAKQRNWKISTKEEGEYITITGESL